MSRGKGAIGARENRRRIARAPKARLRHNVMRQGEAAAIKLAGQICRRIGEDDPAVRAIVARIADIALGGRRVRHVAEELRALRQLEERLLGKPVQPVKGDSTLTVRVVEGDDPGPDAGR